ncbi:MAG: hypothetical protein R3D69_08580 [Xanthobacteraceae bacterium]
MRQQGSFSPLNSIFFIEDKAGGTSPELDEHGIRIWSTPSCIIVGCLMSDDGPTELTLSDQSGDAIAETPAFDGMLDTPSRVVEISTSEREVLLKSAVPRNLTRVRIWTDHPSEPDHILVVLG